MSHQQVKFRSVDEIPSPYRCIFQDYPCFNAVQSAVFDEALETDNSLVVSAPTGSGKTVIFELAIIRLLKLSQENPDMSNNKIVYISPIKALCQERLIDWHKKFSDFGINCIANTSDSDEIDVKGLLRHNLIISTPEKWDIVTRRWKENCNLIEPIRLFLIDEVHLLNADTRGSTLEVIVSRMKTAIDTLTKIKKNIRFVALSATIPNIEDIAEWIGPKGLAKFFKFSEEFRPVKLNKIVMGYHFNAQSQSTFKFDMSLNYKLPSLITKYSEGKPTLIFCNTRKSVEMTASQLVANLQIRLSQEQKENLNHIHKQLEDAKLKQYIIHGIAYHHAGIVRETRFIIEEAFRKGFIPVLVTTSTLAMGVNLPAHLVIVKCTKCYTDGGYKDYDEVSIFQMIGRAGRSQFDSSATALILTTMQDKIKYERMLGCTQTIESNLHKHLPEHLNAEITLRTITDLDVAMRWLSSTFLYVRATRSPEKYKLPAGLSKEKIDKKLLEMCQIDLNKLVRAGMIKMNESIDIMPTIVGQIMAKYYVAFETMNLFTQISGTEIMIQILAIICKCKEFSEIYLRSNDKKCLNMLNKNSNKESNRFPLVGRIKTVDMKVNVIIQAVLGNLELQDQSILCDSIKIMRNCERLANCLIEYLETKDQCYSALLNTIILAKCFRVKLWENSPYVSKQLTGVGHVISNLLVKAGKTSFKEICSTNPRHIEMIVNRKAPFGSSLIEQASHLPRYNIHIKKLDNSAELKIILANPSEIEKKSTINMDSMMTLLVGDSNNNILLYEKYAHIYMLHNPEIMRSVTLENQTFVDFVTANFISENFVGIDCSCKLELSNINSNSIITTNQNQSNLKQNKSKQTYMDMYMNQVKKIRTGKNKKNDSKVAAKPSTVNVDNNNTKSSVAKNFMPETTVASNSLQITKTDNQYLQEHISKHNSNHDNPYLAVHPKNTTNIKIISNSLIQCINKTESSKNIDLQPKIEISSFPEKKDEDHSSNKENEIQNDEQISKSPQITEEDKFNCTIYKNISKKYNFSENGERKDENDHIDNKSIQIADENEQQMDRPNSTGRNAFLLENSFPSRQPPSKHGAFEHFVPKSIKWSSPLVQSPIAKFSPRINRFYFDLNDKRCDQNQEKKENIDNIGNHDSSSSSSTHTHCEIRNKRLNTSTSSVARKRSKYQFPLSDQDCLDQINESFITKVKDVEEICDPEYFGLLNKSRKQYYSQLMSSERKVEENDCSKAINKKDGTSQKLLSENMQQSQDIFSESDFAAGVTLKKPQNPCQDIDRINSRSEFANLSRTPIYTPQYSQLDCYSDRLGKYSNNSNMPTFDNNNFAFSSEQIEDVKPFLAPSNYSCTPEGYPQERYHFNPYLVERHVPPPTSWFGYQRPIYKTPYVMSPCPQRSCCTHRPSYYMPPPETSPYWPQRNPPRNAHQHFNDISDNYLDYGGPQMDRGIYHPQYLSQNEQFYKKADAETAPGQFTGQYGNEMQFCNPNVNKMSIFPPPFVQTTEPQRNRVQPAEMRKELNVTQLFSPAPKRQLGHNSNGFNVNNKTNASQNSFIPPSAQRRLFNINSFEERLNNIIAPNDEENQSFQINERSLAMNRFDGYKRVL